MLKLVFATAAENGGALQNTRELYGNAIKDKKNKWVFITSIVNLRETNNVKNIQIPLLKKDWFHRLKFDLFDYKKIVKENKPDEIYNLQTFFYKDKHVKYIFYATNVLFFTKIKFRISEDRNLFIRQKLLTHFVYSSCKRSDQIVTECDWMADRISEQLKIDRRKVKVRNHSSQIKLEKGDKLCLKRQFFYPASSAIYKNHKALIDAAKIVKDKGIDFKIVLTLNGDESKQISDIKSMCKREGIHIKWVGALDNSQMKQYYLSSVLVFPSYLETVGLPLIEAKEIGSPIICSNLPFATSAIGNYENAEFFQYDNPSELAILMEEDLEKIGEDVH